MAGGRQTFRRRCRGIRPSCCRWDGGRRRVLRRLRISLRSRSRLFYSEGAVVIFGLSSHVEAVSTRHSAFSQSCRLFLAFVLLLYDRGRLPGDHLPLAAALLKRACVAVVRGFFFTFVVAVYHQTKIQNGYIATLMKNHILRIIGCD